MSALLRLYHKRAALAWLFLFQVALSEGSQTLWCEDAQGALQGGPCQEELMPPPTANPSWPALCPSPWEADAQTVEPLDDCSPRQHQLEPKSL